MLFITELCVVFYKFCCWPLTCIFVQAKFLPSMKGKFEYYGWDMQSLFGTKKVSLFYSLNWVITSVLLLFLKIFFPKSNYYIRWIEILQKSHTKFEIFEFETFREASILICLENVCYDFKSFKLFYRSTQFDVKFLYIFFYESRWRIIYQLVYAVPSTPSTFRSLVAASLFVQLLDEQYGTLSDNAGDLDTNTSLLGLIFRFEFYPHRQSVSCILSWLQASLQRKWAALFHLPGCPKP